MNYHHWKDGKLFRDEEPIDTVSKTEANDAVIGRASNMIRIPKFQKFH